MSVTTFIQVGDRRIAYDAPSGTGDGPGLRILLIHGSSFDRRCWTGVAAALAEGHRPVAYDNPGHGESSLPPLASIDDGMELAKELHDSLGWGKTVLIGHSMGGAIVQRYLQQYPEDVLAVGLISTAPAFPVPDELLERWLGDPAVYRAEENQVITAPQCSQEARDRLFEMRDTTTPEGQYSDIMSCHAWDNTERFLEIDFPTLVVTADQDTEAFREAADKWRTALPRCEYVSIPDAGHMMMVEQPGDSAKAIRSWVDRLAHEVR